MIKIQHPATFGNEKAKYNTFPDPIKPYNGMFLEDFEVDRDWTTNPRATYAVSSLIFLPKRSFEYSERRLTGVETLNMYFVSTIAGVYQPPTVYDGNWCGNIHNNTFLMPWSVNHGYWNLQSLNSLRTWSFYMMLHWGSNRSFYIHFAFDGDFTNLNGYGLSIRYSLDRFNLVRHDDGIATTLITSTPSYPADWVWRNFKVTEYLGTWKIYYDNVLMGTAYSNTKRNMPFFGVRTNVQANQGNLAWVDKIEVG